MHTTATKRKRVSMQKWELTTPIQSTPAPSALAGSSGFFSSPNSADRSFTQCEASGTWVTGAPFSLVSSQIPNSLFFRMHSCYMSVILQTFLCNPFLRTYFLSDRHNRLACTKTLQGEPCLCCELDLLFSEVWSLSPPFLAGNAN